MKHSSESRPARLSRLSRRVSLEGREYVVTAHADPFRPDEARIFQAWERSSYAGPHGTVTSIDGQAHGLVGTDPDRDLYAHLPVGPERSDAVQDAYRLRAALAVRVILAAFPELVGNVEPRVGLLSDYEVRSRVEVAS